MQKPLFPVLLFALSLLAFGCGKDTDTPESADRWVVTKFVDKDGPAGQVANDDDTDRFLGYQFEFESGDLLVIHAPNGSQMEAKWRLHTNDTVLSISMENPPALLEEIVGNWSVDGYSATAIKLVNSNWNGGAVDFSAQALRIEFSKL